MSPDEIQQVKDLIAQHDYKPEPWSFKKFFMGFVSMQNYAKALVLGFCIFIILVVGYSVYTAIAGHFKPQSTSQKVGTNQGIVATKNEDKQGNTNSLINFLNWR